jgi:protein-tyrosine phosphatase
MTTQVLFICTGNYYRSRFAELYFNHLARTKNLAWMAVSRGLRVQKGKNPGSVSPLTLAYLSAKGVAIDHPLAEPAQLSELDLTQATMVIVLDENEHRPMLQVHFPHWEDKVHYWQFEDDYLRPSEQVLPALAQQVVELLNSLSKQPY